MQKAKKENELLIGKLKQYEKLIIENKISSSSNYNAPKSSSNNSVINFL